MTHRTAPRAWTRNLGLLMCLIGTTTLAACDAAAPAEEKAAGVHSTNGAARDDRAQTAAAPAPEEAGDGDGSFDEADKEGGTGSRARGEEGTMAAAPPVPPGVMGGKGKDGLFAAKPMKAGANMADPWAAEKKSGGQGQGLGYGSGRSAPSDDSIAPEPVGLVPIDPNGRFSTTYRPGAGHLAAFEAALARGIVPEQSRELVSDIGARYAPKVSAPSDKAIGFATELERTLLPPSGGDFHVRIGLQSIDKDPVERPALSVHLVLDTSGSMRGESIESAREAAAAVVDKLDAKDTFSLVKFSSNAEVVVPAGAVGPRRAQIKNTIADIHEGGGTNIGEGLTLAYEEAGKPAVPKDAVKVVLLLSDGRANSGITNPQQLSKLALDSFQDGIQTSSFGLGTDYDGALMSSIADDGAGGYYYLRDPEQISPALTTELEERVHPVATAVEVRVRLKEGVELLHVYGSRRLSDAEAARVRAIEVAADKQAEERDKIKTDREHDNEGGMRFFIPAFAQNESHAIVLKLRTGAAVGEKSLAQLEVKYKDRVFKKNVIDEIPIDVTYADSDAKSYASRNLSVVKTAQGFEAGEVLGQAARLIANGGRMQAATLLSEREGILRLAADVLDEPLFLRDADRIARLRSHASGSMQGVGDPLVLAMLMETAGRVHMR